MGTRSAGIVPGTGTEHGYAFARLSTVGLIALVAAAALDISGRFAEVGPARFTVYQLLALVMTLSAAWLLLTRRVEWRRTPLDLPMLAFLAACAFSLVFATDLAAAVVQLASLGSSVILVALIALFVDSPRRGALVVGGVLATAAVFGVFALVEWAGLYAVQHPVFYTPGYGIRARVTFLDPNILASFLMFAVLLASPLLASAPMDRRVRALGFLAAAAALGGLTATYSRGGLGGLVIGLVAAAVLLRVPRRVRAVFIGAMMTAVLVAGAVVFDTSWVSENVVGAGETGSATNRVYMIEGALKMWRDNPFGVGLDNYQVRYPEYRDPRAEEGIVESHTAYVTVLAETGFIGLAAFMLVLAVALFGTAGRAARRASDATVRALATGAFAATLALSAQAFTYSLEASKFWWFAIGLGVAAWRLLGSGEPPADGSGVRAGSPMGDPEPPEALPEPAERERTVV